jgi:adenylate cyclase
VLIEQPGFSLEHWRNIPPDRTSEPRERDLEGLGKAGLKVSRLSCPPN